MSSPLSTETSLNNNELLLAKSVPEISETFGHFLLRCTKGMCNGLYAGGKIRFFHSLVAILLLRKGRFKDKIVKIIESTYIHARNVGLFVLIYKICKTLLEFLTKTSSGLFPLISGFAAGYIAFHKDNDINRQITLYALSRVFFAYVHKVKNLAMKRFPIIHVWFPLLSGISWGLMLFIFENERHLFTASVKKVFEFIYKDSDRWDSWRDFIPFDFNFF